MNLPDIISTANLLPPDGGIIYTETNMQRHIPEPLNTITAVFFIAVAIYWLIRFNGFSAQFGFLSVAAYILLIGGIGGTVYHGLRQYRFIIMMDWIPILLLCMMTCLYFWVKILHRWLYAIGLVFLFFLFQFMVRRYTEQHHSLDWIININYAVMALMVMAPVLIYLTRTRFRHSMLIFGAILCFLLALFFRISDKWQILQIGTHFLWHALGAITTQLMFLYLYRIDRKGKRISI